MDFGNGGYVLVRLPNDLNFEDSGRPVTLTVSRDVVDKLKQFDKPVLFEHFWATIEGSRVDAIGYSAHTQDSGVHHHYVCGFNISVIGDTQITVTPN